MSQLRVVHNRWKLDPIFEPPTPGPCAYEVGHFSAPASYVSGGFVVDFADTFLSLVQISLEISAVGELAPPVRVVKIEGATARIILYKVTVPGLLLELPAGSNVSTMEFSYRANGPLRIR